MVGGRVHEQVHVGDERLIEDAHLAVQDQRTGGEVADGISDVGEPLRMVHPRRLSRRMWRPSL